MATIQAAHPDGLGGTLIRTTHGKATAKVFWAEGIDQNIVQFEDGTITSVLPGDGGTDEHFVQDIEHEWERGGMVTRSMTPEEMQEWHDAWATKHGTWRNN